MIRNLANLIERQWNLAQILRTGIEYPLEYRSVCRPLSRILVLRCDLHPRLSKPPLNIFTFKPLAGDKEDFLARLGDLQRPLQCFVLNRWAFIRKMY